MGSQDTTSCPSRLTSALKLAGPPAQSRILPNKSWGVRSNIPTYSAFERPQGTTFSSLNLLPSSSPFISVPVAATVAQSADGLARIDPSSTCYSPLALCQPANGPK